MKRRKSEIVADVLRKEFPGGVVDPDRLLRVVGNPKHVLHKYIDWSEANAIREYRLRQVEQLIRTAKMMVRYGDVEREAPLCVHRPGTQRLYVFTEDIDQAIEKGLHVMDELRALRGHVERFSGVMIALGFDPAMHEAYITGLTALEVQMSTPPKVSASRRRRARVSA